MLSPRKTTNSRDSKFTNTVENTFTIHIISTLTFELSKFMSKFDGQFSVRRNFRCRCAVKIEQIAACKLDCIAAAEMRQLVNHPMFGCGEAAEDNPSRKFRQNVGAANVGSDDFVCLRKLVGGA